jgi:hypothetical protein
MVENPYESPRLPAGPGPRGHLWILALAVGTALLSSAAVYRSVVGMSPIDEDLVLLGGYGGVFAVAFFAAWVRARQLWK